MNIFEGEPRGRHIGVCSLLKRGFDSSSQIRYVPVQSGSTGEEKDSTYLGTINVAENIGSIQELRLKAKARAWGKIISH